MPFTSRFSTTVATFIACAAVAACGGSTPTAPAATPQPTMTTLTVSAPPGTMKVGETVQLTATASFLDGHRATSGFAVTWTTSNATVAAVSATGLVTAKADGNARISASTSEMSAWADVRVFGGRRLAGYVVVSPAAAFVTVAGARVTVIDGPSAGTSATTDESGHFTLFDVDGVLNLRASAPGFDEVQTTGNVTSPGITIELIRSDHPVIDSAQWSVPGGDPRQIYQGTLTFGMRSSGRVDLSTSASLASGESAPLCSELRDEDNRMVWTMRTIWQGGADATLMLEGGRRYTLKINNCFGETGRPEMYGYRLFAIHPA